MIRSVVAVVIIQLVILINGCSGNPPKPVLPDGLHRVPVNRVPPVPQSDGGGHE
ncbi:putative lipoprotein [Paraburkholderia xenovorans LB400]|nr:putative lipoprotein [Paraburkholderia xenovorans LB400]